MTADQLFLFALLVVVFACGEPLRGDDSVAHVACRALPAEVLARADVKLVGALEAEYLRDLASGVRAVIVDAVVGPAPGEIVEIPLLEMSGRGASVVTTSMGSRKTRERQSSAEGRELSSSTSGERPRRPSRTGAAGKEKAGRSSNRTASFCPIRSREIFREIAICSLREKRVPC